MNDPSMGVMSLQSRERFNNKEILIAHGLNMLDYGARFYDGAIIRWKTPDELAYKRPWKSPYSAMGNNPILNVDPDGRDYWSTNDPELIRQFLNSVGSGSGQHDFSGWNHATDAEFTSNLAYNDETGKFYTSYGTIENGVLTAVGRSFDANITPVSYSGEGYPGAFVYKYENEIWSFLYSFMYGITPFSDYLGPINPSSYGPWEVNSSGRITGIAPSYNIGVVPFVGKGGKVGKISTKGMPHGDGGRALNQAGKRIAELQKQLQTATGKEKKVIPLFISK